MQPSFNKSRRYRPVLLILLSLLVLVSAFGAIAWRINRTPDIFTDEIIYTRLGVRVGGEGALVWDNGQPFIVHPPLYFLLEGLFENLTGHHATPLYGAGDIFASVYHARLLNALLSALTALLLFWIGYRLRGPWLGLLLAALFILDPFVIRTNRRAMIETSAALFSLVGLAVLLSADRQKPLRLWRGILAGLAFGAALLTKELTFVILLAVLLLAVWEAARWAIRHWKKNAPGRQSTYPHTAAVLVVSVLVALVTYSLYPVWVIIAGNWDEYYEVKGLGLERLLGLVQLTGWNRPGQSLGALLLQRLQDYGSTYLVMGFGGLAVIALLIWGRRDRNNRLLAALGLVYYPFFAFLALVGTGNDQFFYFLLLPSILLVGYTGFLLNDLRSASHSFLSLDRLPSWMGKGLLLFLLILVFPFNAFLWARDYGQGTDNGYTQLTAYVRAQLPPDAPLNASGDPIKFRYFLPDQPIAAAATSQEAQALGLHYFVLAPKDVRSGYGRITPELANWIRSNGVLLFATGGNSYGKIYLYRVDYAPPPAQTVAVSPDAKPGFRSFHRARSAFTGDLVVMLALWSLLCSGAALGSRRFGGHEPTIVVTPSIPEEYRETPPGKPVKRLRST